MKNLFLWLLLFCCINAEAQDFSNKGKDFWIAYTGHIDGTTSRMALYITSDVAASGTVQVNGNTIPFTVTANQVTTVQLTNTSFPSNAVAYNAQIEGVGANKGIHITANKPVVVYAHILNAARSGSTLVLPTTVLGKEYFVSSYKTASYGTNRRSQFAVVATQDNTTIEVLPTQSDASGAHAPNVPFQVSLAKGDVYQYQSDDDLTGTSIKSIATINGTCKPVAVFSGSTFTAMGCGTAGSGDNLYQQLFPFASWGKVYYTAPFKSRAYDIFRILVQDAAEPVYVNGVALSPANLIGGRFYEINTIGNNTPRIITSNKPICVLQYMITQACDGVNSDPEMVVLNAVEQTLNDITVMSARRDLTPPNTNITNHYLNIIFKTNAFSSLKIDGASPTAFPVAIPGTEYSYIQEDVTSTTLVNPSHRITSDSGFICIAYGYGNVESYGYNAGTNVKDLYQFISIKNQYSTIDFPATCKDAPFNFSITLPYLATSLSWDFGNHANLTPNKAIVNNAPVPDSSFIRDGRLLYVYKLPSVYSFAAAGTYPVKVTANNPTPDGCSGTQEISFDVEVFEPPTANFFITGNNCLGDTLLITDSSTASRPIVRWLWSYGDGSTDNVKNPVKTYKKPGKYNVELTAITDIGCINHQSKSFEVNALPFAKFALADTLCETKQLIIRDSSVANEGNLNLWYWNFGDATSDTYTTAKPLVKKYDTAGSYTVSLAVQNSFGCVSDTLFKTFTVHPQPQVGFILPEVCLSDAFAQFFDTTSMADGTESTLSYLWYFDDSNATAGNANNATIKNPKHKYLAANNHQVSLQVTSAHGCTEKLEKVFTVNGDKPVANFTVVDAATLCSNTEVKIENGATVNFGAVTKVEIVWDVANAAATREKDDNPAAGKVYKHKYPDFQSPASKNIQIRYVAYSGSTCVDSTTKTITLQASPKVSFSTMPGICFEVSSRQITQAIETSGLKGGGSYYGNGVSINGLFTPSATGVGTNDIKYLYTTDKGCSDSATQPITIWPSPIAKWQHNAPLCEKNNVRFTDSSVANYSNIVQWNWNFGDATVSNKTSAQPFTKMYDSAGNYKVSLQVITDSGCVSMPTEKTLAVQYIPRVNFSMPVVCLPDGKGKFSSLSTIPDGTEDGFTYVWNFGDKNNPAASTVKEPIHRYSDTGVYHVQLIVRSNEGCIDSASKVFNTVYAQPKAAFSALPTELCLGGVFQFTDSSDAGKYAIKSWHWTFGDGSVDTMQNTTKKYASAATYNVDLFYINELGCVSDTFIKKVVVHPYPNVNAGPDLVVLEGGNLVLNPIVSGNNLTYKWSPATYLDNDAIVKPRTTPLADIVYNLTVTGSGGCATSDNVAITILKSVIAPNVFTPNGDGINDKWEIRYLESYPGATVELFNRYGQRIFYSEGSYKAWDGTVKGVPVPVGTYYYIINPKNGRKQVAGFVDVIR